MPQDYLLRLIDQISIMLAEIARLVASGDGSGARAEISERCRQNIGLDITQIQHMSPEALGQLLETSAGLRQTRAVMIAELLLKDAEMHPDDPSRVSLDRLHSFCLLASVVDSLDAGDQRVYRQKLEGLRDYLSGLSDNPYVTSKLAQFAATRKA
ncbi:MAG TPA: hypothetical protein VH188_12900 [Chthoniobacterales bacterium]|jgi:hypothetical protein|nr:hypothetical protein [Chthoniobacterales bacterium]